MDQVNQPLGAGSPATRNVIDRAKNIITQPAKEWDVIALEQPNTSQIITGYVLPLAGAAAIAAFIGYAFVGYNVFGVRISGIDWGIYQALTVLVTAIVSVFICAMVIDALAPSFGSEKNMGRSVQLVAYSYTPGWIGGLLALYPPLSMIGALFGLYGLYIMYIGLPKMKKTPQDKQISYFVVSLITVIVIYFIMGLILSAILMPIFGLSYGTRTLF
jgi:hypothetical protein